MITLFIIYIIGVITTILLTRYFNKAVGKGHNLYTRPNEIIWCLLSWYAFSLYTIYYTSLFTQFLYKNWHC